VGKNLTMSKVKYIRFKKSTAYNDAGDETKVLAEDDKAVYYYDGCHRYCYLDKVEDKDTFVLFERKTKTMTASRLKKMRERHEDGQLENDDIDELFAEIDRLQKQNLTT